MLLVLWFGFPRIMERDKSIAAFEKLHDEFGARDKRSPKVFAIAAPFILFGKLPGYLGGVPVNITNRDHKLLFRFYGNAVEAILEQMPRAFVARVEVHRVADE